MQSELETLFDQIDPPPDGAAGLRRRLRNEPRRRRRHVATAALGGALVVGGLFFTLYRQVAQPSQAEIRVADFNLNLVALGLQDAPSQPAFVPPDMRHRLALQRVALESDRVVFYYFAVLPEPPSTAVGAGSRRSGPLGEPEEEGEISLEN